MLKNKLQILVIGLVSIATTLAIGWPRPAAMNKAAIPQKDYQIVASVPVGDNGVHYSNVGVPEAEVIGPASFRAGRDGTFLIAETSTNRILTIDRNGVLRQTTVPSAVGIVDLALTANGNLLALDLGQRVVHRIGPGNVTEKIQLPESFWTNGLSGIGATKDGKPILELKGGSKRLTPAGEDIPTKSVLDRDIAVEVPDLGNEAADPFRGVISDGQKSAQINVGNLLGGLNVLGQDKTGGVFVSVLELMYGPVVRVDETVWHFDKDLNVIEKARVPLAERFMYVQRGVDIDENGNVFAMIPRSNQVDIVKLIFKRDLPVAFSEDAQPSSRDRLRAHAALTPLQTACSRTRNQMVSAANAYLNNSTYLTTKNLTGYCTGRTPPRYLGTTAGYKSSVPYDWGGGNTVSEYNSYMAQGYQAGNIDTSTCCGISCAKGVDCSGFVSRGAWGTSQKYGTSGLTTISTQLSDVRQLQFGDILDCASYPCADFHVVMFDRLENGGIDDWESTLWGKQDRVVYQYSSWTRLNYYKPYRYNGVCNTGTVSMSVSPTNVWMTRGSTATFTIYLSTNDGYQGSVNLYALNLPGGTPLPGTGFSPQTVKVTANYSWFTSTFKLVTNSTTPTGTRTITIQGYSGNKLLTAYVQVTVM